MVIFYSDRTAIESMTKLEDLRQYDNNSGHKLPSVLLTQDLNFSNLYENWIRCCVDCMWFFKYGRKPEARRAPQEEQERCRRLFFKGTEEETGAFLDEYTQCLTTPGLLRNGITMEKADKLREEIDRQIGWVSAHIRLRYIAVCVFVNLPPEQILAEGSQWPNFVSEDKIPSDEGGKGLSLKDEILCVKDGMTFSLNAAGAPETACIPRTLKNESQKLCSITLICGETRYSVKFPPQGILRAVFTDAECRTISCLKGTISCDRSTSAVIQKGTPDRGGLIDVTDWDITEYPPMGNFTDASADENGGFLLLTRRKMYSNTRDFPPPKGPLPIRCFRSGNQWARLYADGHLECCLGLGEERTRPGVTAVVEDGEHGLLLYDREGAWDHRQNGKKAIPPEEFYRLMMRRFAAPDYCEAVETQFMRIVIHQNGEAEVMQK